MTENPKGYCQIKNTVEEKKKENKALTWEEVPNGTSHGIR